jgi:hypothetical protein
MVKTFGHGLVIDIPEAEGGTSVLAGQEGIDIIEIVAWDEIDELYQALRPNGSLGGKYKWLAEDTVTGLQHLAMRQVKKTPDAIQSQRRRIDLQDWGAVGDLMTSHVHQFRRLPMNVLFLAQERPLTVKDELGEEIGTVLVPDVSPMALRALIPPLSLVGRLFWHEKDNGEWEQRLRIGRHVHYVTKYRSQLDKQPPAVVRRPNLGQIFAYLMGKDVKRPLEAKESPLLMEL